MTDDDGFEDDFEEDDEEATLDLGGLLGGMDMDALLGAAQSMQAQIFEAQRQAAQASVVGSSGGGAVEIEADGSLAFTRVHISTDAIDPDDPTMLEDLVLAALHDVVARIEALHVAANPLAGIDLGALGGISSGAAPIGDHDGPGQLGPGG